MTSMADSSSLLTNLKQILLLVYLFSVKSILRVPFSIEASMHEKDCSSSSSWTITRPSTLRNFQTLDDF